MRHLADDIVLSVKDAVRNLRFAIRSEAEQGRPADPDGSLARRQQRAKLGRRRGRMAGLVDQVFTEVESGALAIVSPGRASRGAAPLHSVSAYFGRGADNEAAARLFARSHYHAAKVLMRRLGARNVLIHEHVIARTRDEVIARDPGLVAAVRDDEASPPDRVRLCAAIACRLAAARPIREADPIDAARSRQIVSRPNEYCFAAVGLATAIASLRDAGKLPSAAEIVESAASVVEVRFERFTAAFEAADPVEALAREFEKVLPVLP